MTWCIPFQYVIWKMKMVMKKKMMMMMMMVMMMLMMMMMMMLMMLMKEILHQLRFVVYPITGCYASQVVVWDFFPSHRALMCHVDLKQMIQWKHNSWLESNVWNCDVKNCVAFQRARLRIATMKRAKGSGFPTKSLWRIHWNPSLHLIQAFWRGWKL